MCIVSFLRKAFAVFGRAGRLSLPSHRELEATQPRIRHNLVTIWPLCMRKSNLPAQESLAVAVSALFVSNVCMTSEI
jgi:hypothetical protein